MKRSNSQFMIIDPFGELGVDLSPSELRETAYEILVAVCRSPGHGRPLTYVSNSSFKDRSQQLSARESMRKSVTMPAEGSVKETLGLQLRKVSIKEDRNNDEIRADSERGGGASAGEFLRVQMRISEQTDSKIRRGLLRVAAAQLGRRVESMVLPLELLRQFRSSDFSSEKEHDAWQRRYLKVLQAGLLIQSSLPHERSAATAQRLQMILYTAFKKPSDFLKHSESMGILCSVVNSHASTMSDGSASEVCHWADGTPLNLHLYRILLESCFDVNDEASIIEEVDEMLEQVKKTWVILGINQEFHNLCLFWVIFHRYISTGESEDDLLFASNRMIVEIEKDAGSFFDQAYVKILHSTLDFISDWARKRLSRYHETFYRGNIDVMQLALSLSISAAKIVHGMTHQRSKKRAMADVACALVESYIRSSMRNTFVKEREGVISSIKSAKGQRNLLPFLSILAQNICDVAFNEKEIYSPVLKTWHPVATGVAVATLHSCFASELKQFVLGTSELNPEAIQVLLAAGKLEIDLVQMAVVDSVDSEDGGKAIIQEMTPYEAETAIRKLVKSWVQTRIDRLGEWVERVLQKEDWNPQANQGRFAPSSKEVLRFINETLEAFFLLPIPNHPLLLPELMAGLDKCIQKYILQAMRGCGSRLTYIPTPTAPTRAIAGSKLSPFKRKDRSLNASDKTSRVHNGNDDNSFKLTRLCLRINTFYNILKELETVEKQTVCSLKNSGFSEDENVAKGKFIHSRSSCLEAIKQLSEATAYKVVFCDLSHVLQEYLYIGEISSSRIELFIEELERSLEVISSAVHDRVRTRVITNVMKASFEGFLFVLLAGGPSRAFSLQDAEIIVDDFKLLTDLFWSNGDGLPADLISKLADNVTRILSLFETPSEDLIKKWKSVVNVDVSTGNSGDSSPSTSCDWSASDPNTILRVLCCRNDKVASKFLKRNSVLPKKV